MQLILLFAGYCFISRIKLLCLQCCFLTRSSYIGRSGNPLFSVHDNLSPVVTTEQNFDRSAASCHIIH